MKKKKQDDKENRKSISFKRGNNNTQLIKKRNTYERPNQNVKIEYEKQIHNQDKIVQNITSQKKLNLTSSNLNNSSQNLYKKFSRRTILHHPNSKLTNKNNDNLRISVYLRNIGANNLSQTKKYLSKTLVSSDKINNHIIPQSALNSSRKSKCNNSASNFGQIHLNINKVFNINNVVNNLNKESNCIRKSSAQTQRQELKKEDEEVEKNQKELKDKAIVKKVIHKEKYTIEELSEMSISGQFMNHYSNYLIGKQIGQGAYSTVKFGIHLSSNTTVAIKIYEKEKLIEPQRFKSVQREIKILQKMMHPNIVKMHEAFDTKSQVIIKRY